MVRLGAISIRILAKVYSASPIRQSAFIGTKKACTTVLEKAGIEPTQKRRDKDARLNINASKWRYACTSI